MFSKWNFEKNFSAQLGREKQGSRFRHSLGGQRRSWKEDLLSNRQRASGKVEGDQGHVQGPGDLQVQGGFCKFSDEKLSRESDSRR